MNTIRYLGQQCPAICGKYKSDCLKEVSGELDSNFIQLLKVLAEEKPNLTKWMVKNQVKFRWQVFKMNYQYYYGSKNSS